MVLQMGMERENITEEGLWRQVVEGPKLWKFRDPWTTD